MRRGETMKKTISNLISLTIVTLFANPLYASEWIANIHTNKNGYSPPYVTIGVAINAETWAYPPEIPTAICYMHLSDINQSSNIYKRDIRQKGALFHHWIVSVNPHGNETGPGIESATVLWNISELGPGKFFILEGPDMDDNFLISDMKTQSSFVSSADKNKYLHYSIINTPGLSDLVGTLKILAGFSSEPVFTIDIDQDGQTELADAICMIRHLAKQ